MKFTNGYWMLQEDVKAYYAAQAYTVKAEKETLTVQAPTHLIKQRGDTLGGVLLTVRLSSPMADVIGVSLSHFHGVKSAGPQFEILRQDGLQVDVLDGPEAAVLSSGNLSARVRKTGGWGIDFLAGERVVTSSGPKATGYIEKNSGEHYLHEQLALGVGEMVYGLGERFSAFVKNGQVVDLWNKDGGTSSEQTYKNVPFYLTNRGYGVFVNHPGLVSFEVASEKNSRVQFSAEGEALEYFVIYGPSPKEILEKYTALTGRPALPPAWSFGLWLTTSFTTSYDEATVSGFIDGMAQRDLPLGVFHFDCFWMKEFQWCDLTWDERVFPDPEGMLARLKQRGLHICLWINPYIAQDSAMFGEGMANGYLLKKANGDVWQWDMWQPGMGIVDFTNPAAVKWYQDKLRLLVKMGVDAFKTDFGERIPTDVVYWDGSDPEKMHNYYPFLYNRAVFEVLEEERGLGEAVLFARSATAGSQQFPAHWGGDSESNFESMAESLRGGLSLGLSGFGFWSHDIGGFEGTPPAAVYKRWLAFGLLSSHSRLHGSNSYRVPWLYDDEAVDVLRLFTKLKLHLMPYLFAAGVEAHQKGVPVMRAMLLEFAGDPACEYLDRQYMLGESLLTAPIFAHDGSVRYYLPAGRWTHLLTDRVVVGPGWQEETHDFFSLPLLVRPNSVIAMGREDGRADYDYADGVILQAYELADGSQTVVIPNLDGTQAAAFILERGNGQLEVTREGAAKPWQLLLVGAAAVKSVSGGAAESTPRGVLITPSGMEAKVRVTL